MAYEMVPLGIECSAVQFANRRASRYAFAMSAAIPDKHVERAAHPGTLLRIHVLPTLQLSRAQAARDLGITRQTLHRIMSGQAAITPAMAMRLDRFCGVPCRFWLERQNEHDLARLADMDGMLAGIPARSLAPQTLEQMGAPRGR